MAERKQPDAQARIVTACSASRRPAGVSRTRRPAGSVAGTIALLAAGPCLGRVTWPLLGIMLGLAALHPVIPFSLEFLALRRLTASAFGTLMSLEPAIALLAGLLVLRQVPGASSAARVVLVVIAGIAATRTGGRERVPEDHRQLADQPS